MITSLLKKNAQGLGSNAMTSPMKRRVRNVVVNEDRISKLPNDLILQILSQLPTKDVITTSSLSKEWRFRWKMVPKLIFESGYHEAGTFARNVCKSLLAHKAPVLESLQLEVELDHCDDMDIGILLGIALGRNVRELSLDAYDEKEKIRSFVFPTSLLTSETLETLVLRFVFLDDVPLQICLKSLKTLHLEYMEYKDEASLLNLLSGCPSLETLLLRRYPYGDDEYIFTIAAGPSLLNLSIYDERPEDEHLGYVINAPRLKFLHFESNGPDSCLIENSPDLVKANIICNTIILEPITSVKTLTLLLWTPLELTYPAADSIFYRLEYLELYTSKPAWWNLLTLMLDTSPNLRVLKLLTDESHTLEDHVVCERWNQPENVPQCLLLHLEMFVLEGYKGKREEEKEVAKYVLTKASHLRKATFFGIDPSLREISEPLDELKSVVMASETCEVVFDFA